MVTGSPELDIANGNFFTLFSALGLGTCYAGHMDVRTMRCALDRFDPALAQRAGREEGRYFEQGIDADRIARYVKALRAILAFATERGAFIAWS